MSRHIVLYAVVTEDDDSGIFVDHCFLGGIVKSKKDSEVLAKELAGDQAIPGTVITKAYQLHDDMAKKIKMANRFFAGLAREIYEVEEIQNRKKRRRN